MNRNELIAAIKQHEADCKVLPGAGFTVLELMELAPGVIAASDDDGEFTLYFDLTSIQLLPNAPLSKSGEEIPDMPEDIGFIECLTAESFDDIVLVAKECLDVQNWHGIPVPLDY